MREIYYGKDIRKIYPKNDYKIEPSDVRIKPYQLYTVKKYHYESNTVEFEECEIVEEEEEDV